MESIHDNWTAFMTIEQQQNDVSNRARIPNGMPTKDHFFRGNILVDT